MKKCHCIIIIIIIMKVSTSLHYASAEPVLQAHHRKPRAAAGASALKGPVPVWRMPSEYTSKAAAQGKNHQDRVCHAS
jgi:hypothetical protein